MSLGETTRVGTGALGRVIVMRLGPGSDLYRSLEDLAVRENIKAGVILSGAASIWKTVLRNVKAIPTAYPITDEGRLFLAKEAPMELVSLTGNFSQREDGGVHVHAHFVISNGLEEGRTYGGHLIPGTIIGSLGEIVVAELTGVTMVRRIDPESKAPEIFFG